VSLAVDIETAFSAAGAERFRVAADFDVESGETLVVLGPSGSGKTLLLETVAGFHSHEGTVALDGRSLADVPPERREFGFVFQDYALFPNMTVRENVAFGTRYHGTTRDPDELLAELGVAELAERDPRTLSGGERQRVALARALAVRPEVLLLDEPLSSLDVPTRQRLRDDMQEVLDGMTAVHVTHNRTTARALADRIVVMADGRIVQHGTPEAVFDRPASPLVARFTGSNCLPLDAVPEFVESLAVAHEDDDTHLAVRPEAVVLNGPAPDFAATVERVVREDATTRVTLRLADGAATLDAFTDDPPRVSETVGVSLPHDDVTLC
jgi:ABC-type Fe3+/spermidine/putrescine transport system ATPase subunit